jgi:hypothetical protein
MERRTEKIVDTSQYRRTYFALVKTLAMSDEARHEFNFRETGKYSTSEFAVDDWRLVVSRLQILAGQPVKLGNPRIRSQRGGTPGSMITPAQLGVLVDLVDRVAWRFSAVSFVRSRLLSPLRQSSWSGRWEDLFRSEATAAISAMQRMAGEVQKTA